jgi:large subunit ribosomal protein L31
MKPGLHPTYNQAAVACACGNKFVVGSTVEKISVEICANCHPFYTGKAKFIDTAGRMDKFAARLEKKAAIESTKTEKKPRVKNNKEA